MLLWRIYLAISDLIIFKSLIFDLNDSGMATDLRLGSEVDMGTPDFLQ